MRRPVVGGRVDWSRRTTSGNCRRTRSIPRVEQASQDQHGVTGKSDVRAFPRTRSESMPTPPSSACPLAGWTSLRPPVTPNLGGRTTAYGRPNGRFGSPLWVESAISRPTKADLQPGSATCRPAMSAARRNETFVPARSQSPGRQLCAGNRPFRARPLPTATAAEQPSPQTERRAATSRHIRQRRRTGSGASPRIDFVYWTISPPSKAAPKLALAFDTLQIRLPKVLAAGCDHRGVESAII